MQPTSAEIAADAFRRWNSSHTAGVLDWLGMRKALAQMLEDFRDEKSQRWTQAELARRSGVSKATITRLFDTDKDPDRRTSLDTIHKLVTTMRQNGGLFIGRFERSGQEVTPAVTDEVEDLPSTPPPTGGGISTGAVGHDQTVSVTLALPRLNASESRLLQHIGAILLGASTAPLLQAEDEPAPSASPRRRASDRQER